MLSISEFMLIGMVIAAIIQISLSEFKLIGIMNAIIIRIYADWYGEWYHYQNSS